MPSKLGVGALEPSSRLAAGVLAWRYRVVDVAVTGLQSRGLSLSFGQCTLSGDSRHAYIPLCLYKITIFEFDHRPSLPLERLVWIHNHPVARSRKERS